jgi:hypothetical protein
VFIFIGLFLLGVVFNAFRFAVSQGFAFDYEMVEASLFVQSLGWVGDLAESIPYRFESLWKDAFYGSIYSGSPGLLRVMMPSPSVNDFGWEMALFQGKAFSGGLRPSLFGEVYLSYGLGLFLVFFVCAGAVLLLFLRLALLLSSVAMRDVFLLIVMSQYFQLITVGALNWFGSIFFILWAFVFLFVLERFSFSVQRA